VIVRESIPVHGKNNDHVILSGGEAGARDRTSAKAALQWTGMHTEDAV
jgi:hypothetical protein